MMKNNLTYYTHGFNLRKKNIDRYFWDAAMIIRLKIKKIKGNVS